MGVIPWESLVALSGEASLIFARMAETLASPKEV